ncbi:hypothetical protein EBA01_18295 [Xanthomonas oryzae pv. oryzae]|nr:hypothetical protein C0L89_18300 [Xanthomonas oryzae pv. oryzae]AVU03987.1 hypothetical protein C0L90_18615 [Xanthomonas oryzae pv. oryzae]QBI13559.1 hypothetical protein EYR02_18515 [Xanthomonas oryzae pv. oryzae]QBN29581.1 hypothetical protein EBA01_18295 [Xanthomonas oryzae pv. oryzae]QBN33241.1 hypothetical protein EBA02_18485 [Xanthomonas oryzae pv. oryzae]
MICSSEKRFFTSNLLGIGNWTPNQGATQNRGDVDLTMQARLAERSTRRWGAQWLSASIEFDD